MPTGQEMFNNIAEICTDLYKRILNNEHKIKELETKIEQLEHELQPEK